ncbi:MAG: site-2 protease family protein [Candidatus Nanopelagicales bacterium]|nr:site-2 protease family protein [Candidatus Nanopelagicales bacterium]MCF8538704.1 site-2 protease family protein [Candidatus Nanopelagicales bacterium]MCF8550823.1 site-2 protease family protein [Candidatus Nanopelagicales bacterium]
MLEVVGIVLFAALIAASIALHELGHLVPAKKFGVRVSDYMVGFGPTLWSTVRGETRYGVKWIPLGGYIRMIGMLPPDPADPEGRSRSLSTGRFAALIAQARAASFDEIRPGDENRLFYKLPVHRRVIIMLGGPFMNLVLAFVLFAIVLVGIGLPQPSLSVGAVVPCTPSLEQPTGQPLPSGVCPAGTVPTPAATAGLVAEDVIVAVNNIPAQDWTQVSEWIAAHPGVETTVTVDRSGSTTVLPLAIAEVTRPVYDANGVETGASQTVGFLGMRPTFEYERQSITQVPAFMWDLTVRSVEALIWLPVRIYELVSQTLIGGQERDINGPVSVVGASRLGGEIAAMDSPITSKVATFLGLAASLNLFLFLFNLLPVLPLDGGHIAGALYESLKRSIARLRGKPDPGPVDTARLLPVAYVVAGVLLAMGVVVIWADLVKPISLG